MKWDSIKDFTDSLNEIDFLIAYAKRNEKNIAKYRLFNKTAVILLLTKFENFIETFLEEHSYYVLEKHTSSTLPARMKVQYIVNAIEKATGFPDSTKKAKEIENLKCLLSEKETKLDTLKDYRPRTTFNYGKHGSKEIEKMFQIHALDDFITKPEIVMILKGMDSLIAIRNNIIHQDATPSLTHNDIEQHKNKIIRFVELLQREVDINSIKYYNQ